MAYKITIVKTDTVKTKKNEYKVIEKRPYKEGEWEKDYKWREEADPYPLKEVYGYVETESEKEVETKVLEQEIEVLHLTEIIKAINKI